MTKHAKGDATWQRGTSDPRRLRKHHPSRAPSAGAAIRAGQPRRAGESAPALPREVQCRSTGSKVHRRDVRSGRQGAQTGPARAMTTVQRRDQSDPRANTREHHARHRPPLLRSDVGGRHHGKARDHFCSSAAAGSQPATAGSAFLPVAAVAFVLTGIVLTVRLWRMTRTPIPSPGDAHSTSTTAPAAPRERVPCLTSRPSFVAFCKGWYRC